MDNQNRQPETKDQPPAVQQPVNTATANSAQPGEQSASVSEKDIAALLTITNAQYGHKKRQGPSRVLLISVGILIIAAILIAYLVSYAKPSGTPSSTGGSNTNLTTPAGSSATDGTSQQINQDVKKCTNPVNAVTEC